jgi:hypothetical protein
MKGCQILKMLEGERFRWSGVVEMGGIELAKWRVQGSWHTGDFFRVLLCTFPSVYPSVAP